MAIAVHHIVETTITVDRSGIFLLDPDTNALVLHYAAGFSEEERTAWERHPGLARSVDTVILDLTGIEFIDAASLAELDRIARAVALLGSSCVFSGISAEMAKTMAQTGLASAGMDTFATLKRALEHAIAPKRRKG